MFYSTIEPYSVWVCGSLCMYYCSSTGRSSKLTLENIANATIGLCVAVCCSVLQCVNALLVAVASWLWRISTRSGFGWPTEILKRQIAVEFAGLNEHRSDFWESLPARAFGWSMVSLLRSTFRFKMTKVLCMCGCAWVCVRGLSTYVRTYVYTYIHMYVCMCLCCDFCAVSLAPKWPRCSLGVHVCACVCVGGGKGGTYVWMCVCMYWCIYVCMFLYMYVVISAQYLQHQNNRGAVCGGFYGSCGNNRRTHTYTHTHSHTYSLFLRRWDSKLPPEGTTKSKSESKTYRSRSRF